MDSTTRVAEVPRRMSTLSRRWAPGGPPAKPRTPRPAPTPAPEPVSVGLNTDDGLTLGQLADLVLSAVEAGLTDDAPVSAEVVAEQGTPDTACGRVLHLNVGDDPKPAEATDQEPETPKAAAPAGVADLGEKPTTVVLHAADASLESPEDAIARGLRDMEARRRQAGPKRPGPTRW